MNDATPITALASCLATPLFAAPPRQDSVEAVLGPKPLHDGDVVEITDVRATSARLEPGDAVTVRGRVRLDGRPAATLDLHVTQIEGDGLEECDPTQTTFVTRGLHDFEPKMTVKHRGVLHLTLYDARTRRPFGGVCFGTAEQMKRVGGLRRDYYLRN